MATSRRTPNGPRTVFPSAGTLDIAAINGVPIAGHQGAGTVTDITIRTLLTLGHKFAPKRIVSLMKYPGAPSTDGPTRSLHLHSDRAAAPHRQSEGQQDRGRQSAGSTASSNSIRRHSRQPTSS